MKKNIFMAINVPMNNPRVGTTKKVKGLIRAFRNRGYSVYYSSYEEKGISIFNDDDLLVSTFSFKHLTRFKTKFKRFYLLKFIISFLKETNIKIDVFFTRWFGFDSQYLKMIKTAKKNFSSHIIIDMHSYFEGIHFKSLKGKYMVFSTNLYKKKVSKYVDTFLTEGNVTKLFNKPTIKAEIGIDLDQLKEHKYCGSDNELNIISVANERPYHGYDRLINSLSHYYKNPIKTKPIYIHLVGTLYNSTKEMIKKLNLANKVFVYGPLSGKELFDVYDKCNMAVGPICQHRIGGKKDTGLKTKEYFGIGIPYFYSGQETTVPENYPFIFKINDDESFIDFDSIYKFYLTYFRRDDVSSQMRSYAKKNYSWDKIAASFLSNYE